MGRRRRAAPRRGSPSLSCPSAPTGSPIFCAPSASNAQTASLSMLGNEVALWDIMLAAIKLGVVLIPATTLLTPEDLKDRLERGQVRHVIAGAANAGEIRHPGRKLLAHQCRRQRCRLDGLRKGLPACGRLHPRCTDTRRRTAAALLHLRHHHQAEAGAAHPSELSGRASVDHVLDRAAARRHPSQHQLPGLGQARLELFLRTLERRGLHLHLQLRTVHGQSRAGDFGQLRRDIAVRPADRLAHAHPGEPGGLPGKNQGTGRCRRAVEPGSDRAGEESLGDHHPGRLRPDRDHGADRQLPGAAGQSRIHGPPPAGLPLHAPGRRRPARARRGDLPADGTPARRPDGRLCRR